MKLVSLLSPEAVAWRWTAWQERVAGLDFLAPMTARAAGLDEAESVRYTGSGNRYLRRVLRKLDITGQDEVIDFGCGKGSAMRALLEFPFRRVDGVEYSQTLAEIARRNFERLEVPSSRSTIYQQDAGTFVDLDRYTYLYMYYPFHERTTDTVVGNLEASLDRAPRRFRIIYYNPGCHASIVRSGRFTVITEETDKWRNAIRVYEYRQ